jgi:hypothetical protein
MSWEIIVSWSTLKYILYYIVLIAYGYAFGDAFATVKNNERQLTEMKDDLFCVRYMLLLNSRIIAKELDIHIKEHMLRVIEIFEEQKKITEAAK